MPDYVFTRNLFENETGASSGSVSYDDEKQK